MATPERAGSSATLCYRIVMNWILSESSKDVSEIIKGSPEASPTSLATK